MMRTGIREERGSTMPLVIVLLLVLLIGLTLAVDFGGAFTMKSIQGNQLAAARDATMAPPTQFLIKNSDNPGRDVAETVAASLRDSGFEGGIKVYFWEIPDDLLPERRRAFVWGCEITDTWTALAPVSIAMKTIPVGSCIVASQMPYSSNEVWRPDDSGCGVYSYEPGDPAGSPAYTRYTSLAQMPDAIKQEVDELAAEAAL